MTVVCATMDNAYYIHGATCLATQDDATYVLRCNPVDFSASLTEKSHCKIILLFTDSKNVPTSLASFPRGVYKHAARHRRRQTHCARACGTPPYGYGWRSHMTKISAL